jgi:ABC-type multidrug transport system fused ATPase/permease subunit
MPEETKPKVLAEVLTEELFHIKGEKLADKESLGKVFKHLHDAKLSALCFSGGGIRSATFGLGIVQALAKHNLLSKFDYLSTVSGGGYLGSWLSAWIRREQLAIFEKNFKDPELFDIYQKSRTDGVEKVEELLGKNKLSDQESPNQEPKELQYLRTYSNFMSPKVGLLSADTWTLIAIFLRNLFLNWTISLPLISAVLLLPRLFFAIINLGNTGESYLKYPSLILFAVSIIIGAFAVGYILYQLPSNKNIPKQVPSRDTETWVVVLGILPMIGLAFGSTTLWAWIKLVENIAEKSKLRENVFMFPDLLSFNFVPSNDFPASLAFLGLLVFGMALGLLGGTGYLIFKGKSLSKKHRIPFLQVITTVLSGGVGGILIWTAAYNLQEFFQANQYKFLLYATFAVPLYLILFLAAATLFVGLASKFIDDADREWLARYGAWILIVSLTWIILNGLVLFGPIGIDKLIEIYNQSTNSWYDYVKNTIVPIIGAISGFISLFGGFSEKSSAMSKEAQKSPVSKILSVAPRIAGVIFLGFIFVALAYLTGFFMHYFGTFVQIHSPYSAFTNYNLIYNSLEILPVTSLFYSFIWIFALSAFGTLMAFFVNINKFSLHSAYRDRLVRAYLGASKENRNADHFTNFDDKDNFQLHRLKGQKPFHIINATLNLLGGGNLAWQSRKGESFTMSPLHCGSWHLGYRQTNEYCRNENAGNCEHIKYCNKIGTACTDIQSCELQGKSIRLGTAMAISGAAANPNMGYYSSPIVTFLLALFNIRLGWWLGNPGSIGDREDLSWLKQWFLDLLKGKISRRSDLKGKKFYEKSCPTVAVLPLLNETLGRTNEYKRYINVTDGGHFENLALYEPVMRRCRFIVLSDGAADEKFNFGEISNAIEKCKVDLGVEIKFKHGLKLFSRNNVPEKQSERKRFAVAEIIYPDKTKGILLYIRPTFYGTEPTDILHYANANQTFPHQSTGDQMYDEKQFEAYRALGYFTMSKILDSKQYDNLEDFFTAIKDT